MLTEAPLFASFCLTEPDAGSDVSGMRTTAIRKGDKWVINGSKCFITNGGYASFFTVYAKTDKDKGHRGISCFIVPKDDTVTVDKKEDKMGQRASNTATITFNDTEIPLDHLVGEENKGFKLAMMTLDRTRPGVAAMATGIARAAFEFATAYSKERVQFGVPIAMHQGIQFLIADMATKVHLSRLAAWHSAVLLDQGKRNTLESSHAKRFAADSAMEVTTDAVQVYGGYGFIKDYPVEKLMRDAKIMQLYEGTSQIQRLVIARETLLPRRIEEPAAALVASARTRPINGRREPLRSRDDRRRLMRGAAAAPRHRLRRRARPSQSDSIRPRRRAPRARGRASARPPRPCRSAVARRVADRRPRAARPLRLARLGQRGRRDRAGSSAPPSIAAAATSPPSASGAAAVSAADADLTAGRLVAVRCATPASTVTAPVVDVGHASSVSASARRRSAQRSNAARGVGVGLAHHAASIRRGRAPAPPTARTEHAEAILASSARR